ncbi:hypothetical protein AgCh_018706 [Apium graveolens]
MNPNFRMTDGYSFPCDGPGRGGTWELAMPEVVTLTARRGMPKAEFEPIFPDGLGRAKQGQERRISYEVRDNPLLKVALVYGQMNEPPGLFFD